MGLAAMLAFAGPPYVAHATTRLALTLVPLAATLAIPALLVHSLLRSPVSRLVAGLLYGPVAAVVASSAVVLFAAPQLLSAVSTIAPIVPLVQIVFAFGIVGRRYFKSGAAERTATGLNVLAGGLVVGLVPLLVAAFVPTLPGGRFYFLTVLLVPLALARAALKASPGAPAELRTQAA